MAEPFLAEIRIFSFDFAPKGWADCNGQFMPINQNQALFSLLGTTFGGNGQTTFALPNLRDRVPIHVGNGHDWGQAGGQAAHTLTISEMPGHSHSLRATADAGTSAAPGGLALARRQPRQAGHVYGPAQNLVATHAQAVGNAGGSQAHNNMQPYLTLRFCIALQGIFPSRN
jgi:microcystin-dependent protein